MRTCIIIIIIMKKPIQCVCVYTFASYAYSYACDECIRNKHKIKSRNVEILQISSFINRAEITGKGESAALLNNSW